MHTPSKYVGISTGGSAAQTQKKFFAVLWRTKIKDRHAARVCSRANNSSAHAFFVSDDDASRPITAQSVLTTQPAHSGTTYLPFFHSTLFFEVVL